MNRRSFLAGLGAGLAGAALWETVPHGAFGHAAEDTVRAGCPPIAGVLPRRQFRGVWIATVANSNWPSKAGLPVARQKSELIALLDHAVAMGMNAVVLQIRPTADAFYPSQYAPWSQYLTGVPGKDPGYDPLAFALQEAHARNLELHAWFNPYRVSLQTSLKALAPTSPARQHPDWVVSYGGRLYFDPGVPQARKLVEDSVLEVVSKYDVDAVHFDDYFYPYPVGTQQFPDTASYTKYGRGAPSRSTWRRQNINLLIQELSLRIKAAKPWVKFGVSPSGIWRNASSDPLGSATRSIQSYDDNYADTRTWVKSNWLDYVAPQIYWSFKFKPAAYEALVPWWANVVKGTRVHLYIGQAAYKIGASADSPQWSDPNEMPNHLWFNQKYPQVKGDIYFSIASLMSNPLHFTDRLEGALYRHPALVPLMPWLGGSAPHAVSLRGARTGPRNVHLEWDAPPPTSGVAYYAVYRLKGPMPAQNACAYADPRTLIATVRARAGSATQSYIDKPDSPGTYTYFVTALDRLHHESQRSNGLVV